MQNTEWRALSSGPDKEEKISHILPMRLIRTIVKRSALQGWGEGLLEFHIEETKFDEKQNEWVGEKKRKWEIISSRRWSIRKTLVVKWTE